MGGLGIAEMVLIMALDFVREPFFGTKRRPGELRVERSVEQIAVWY